MPQRDEQRNLDQMGRRLDDAIKRVNHQQGTLSKLSEASISHRAEMQRLAELGTRLEVAQKELTLRLEEMAQTGSTQTVAFQNLIEDLSDIAEDFKDALGSKGWVLDRLRTQDEKWSRIYFLFISFLISVVGMTLAIILNGR